MPLQPCTIDGKSGIRWGKSGKCFTGKGARARARQQERAIRASGWTGNARRSTPRLDPTRTATLRRRFETELSVRYRRLKSRIRDLLVQEDAFGLLQKHRLPKLVIMEQSDGNGGSSTLLRNRLPIGTAAVSGRAVVEERAVINQRWQFHTTVEQVKQFEQWLQTQVQVNVLGRAAEQAYWQAYIEHGYRKGAGRAFDDARKPYARGYAAAGADVSDFYAGTRYEFLRSSFAQPETIEKVKLLASRTLTDLKNVNTDMAAQMSRVLTDGLVQGWNPRRLARGINDIIDGPGTRRILPRAKTIARTEIIRAHAEGQLDAMERMGVQKVGVMVEWSATGDDRMCELCAALDGAVMTLKEARGIIPRHPNCRCSHIPANLGEPTTGQLRGKQKVQGAVDENIRREIPKRSKRTLAEQKARSRWAGADKTIAKRRPKSPVKP